MLRIFPPFLLGVVGAAFITEFILWDETVLFATFLAFGVAVVGAIALASFVSSKIQFGLVVWLLMLALGSFLTLSVSNEIFPDSFHGDLSESAEKTYVLQIVDEPQVKKRSIKVVAKLTDDSLSANGKVLLYFNDDSVHSNLKYGDILTVRTKLDKVENPGNPNEFNYKRYLRFHGISYRGYVASGKSEVLSTNNPGVWGHFYTIRRKLIQRLKDSRLDGNELSVASALILGYRADLDKELMSAYAGAGATHVLAVSGLHVGIVYVILNMLLKFLDRRRNTKIFKTILLILLLFGYAALTGLSASVFRAATMFSFVAVGKAIRRDTNIFNTLAASAFVLMAFDPMIVMQVGFQLSYAAVIGIVIIQPRLFDLVVIPQSKLLDWAWSITCVSVAAQIATAPLGLLYFHQFPNFFWISNLLVIPAAAVILYLGFLLFVFSFWEPTLLFFGFILDSLISILNQVVVWIENIPYSILSGIDISTIEALMIYTMIFGVLLFIIQKVRFGLYTSLSVAIVFVILQVVEVHEQRYQKLMTIYNVRGETALALFDGTHVTFIGSSNFYNDEQSMLFHVRHHWWRRGIETEKFLELNNEIANRIMGFNGQKFALVDFKAEENGQLEIERNVEKLDFAILAKSSWNEINQIAELRADQIIVANNFGPKITEKIIGVLNEEYNTPLLLHSNGAVIL